MTHITVYTDPRDDALKVHHAACRCPTFRLDCVASADVANGDLYDLADVVRDEQPNDAYADSPFDAVHPGRVLRDVTIGACLPDLADARDAAVAEYAHMSETPNKTVECCVCHLHMEETHDRHGEQTSQNYANHYAAAHQSRHS